MERNPYQVMKKWLDWDRWNRRFRKIGMQTQIHWQTNKVPSQGGTTLMCNPCRADIALAEVIPAVQFVGWLAVDEPELAEPVIQLFSWMRSQNVEPDPGGTIGLAIRFNMTRTEMRKRLVDNDRADIAVCIKVIVNEPGYCVFWECIGGRGKGPWTWRKHQCSNLDELRALGFEVEIDPDTQKLAKIYLGESWLSRRNCELLEMRNGMFLLRKNETDDFKEQSPEPSK